jgi:isocitrate lyase
MATNPRWQGVERAFKAEDVVRLRGTVHVEHSLARLGAEKLWRFMHEKPFVNALGALTGNQAMQQVKAGLDAIYLSGWQVAGDANLAARCTRTSRCIPRTPCRPSSPHQQHAGACGPDSSRRGDDSIDWLKPIVADAEGGLRRRTERVRADEEHDRGRRGRRALRGSSCRRRRSAVTWAARCSVPTSEAIAKLAGARPSLPTPAALPPCSWRVLTRSRRTC